MRSNLFAAAFLALSVAALAACAPTAIESDDDATSDADDALSTTLSKTEGALKLTVQTKATFETRNNKRVLVVTGSANRNLTRVFSFVPDDAYGEANLLTARKWEIVFSEPSEINTMLSGLPILLQVETVTGNPVSYTAQLKISSQLARFTGSTKVFVESPIDTVFVRDPLNNLRYRGEAHISGGASAFTVTTTDHVDPVVTTTDHKSFDFDWTYESFVKVADPPSDKMIFTATTTTGTLQKRAGVDVFVSSLDITTEDPYDHWNADCEPAVYACLDALPRTQYDLSECGTYRQVNKCIRDLP